MKVAVIYDCSQTVSYVVEEIISYKAAVVLINLYALVVEHILL